MSNEKDIPDDEDFENLDTSSESEDNTEIDNNSENDSEDNESVMTDTKEKASNKKNKKSKKKNDNENAKPKKKRIKQKIIFNVSDTQYDVVKYVAKKIFKWKLSFEADGEWDVFWTDNAVQPEQLARMQPFQKINHFPGMYSLARKNHLGRNLMRMRKVYQENYNFFPPTWLLPAEFGDFKAQFKSNKSKTFIIKPEASCQGRGIFLTKTWENIRPTDHYVAQRYLNKPYLIEGLKFDMRIYVLLAGCDPLKIFLFNEGLARFATEKYHEPSEQNISDVCMHLTNYAINKDNPNFVFNEDADADDIGHKRSITSVFKLLEAEGHNIQKLWDDIKKMIIKTFCSVQPILAHNYKSCQPDEPYNNMCFEVLGFDIMLDHKLKPWLIEVNHTPSFTTDTPLDRTIKKNVIRDSLKLMNISVKNKIKWKNKKRIELQQRVLTGKKLVKTPEQKQTELELAQKDRNEWENINLGGFTKIYPLDNPNEATESYEEFIKESNKWWQEWTGTSIKRNTKKVYDDKLPRFNFSMEKSALDSNPPIIKPKESQNTNNQRGKSLYIKLTEQNQSNKPGNGNTNHPNHNQNSPEIIFNIIPNQTITATIATTNFVGNLIPTEDQNLPLISEAQVDDMIHHENPNYLLYDKSYFQNGTMTNHLNSSRKLPEQHRNPSEEDLIGEDDCQSKRKSHSVRPASIGSEYLISEDTNTRSILLGSRDCKRVDYQYISPQPFSAKGMRVATKQSTNIQRLQLGHFARPLLDKNMQKDSSVKALNRNGLFDHQITRGESIPQINSVDERMLAKKGSIDQSLYNQQNKSQEKQANLANTMYQTHLSSDKGAPKTQNFKNLASVINFYEVSMINNFPNTYNDKQHQHFPFNQPYSNLPNNQMLKVDGRTKSSGGSTQVGTLTNATNQSNATNTIDTTGILSQNSCKISKNKSPMTAKNGKSQYTGNYLQPRLMEFFVGSNSGNSGGKTEENLMKALITKVQEKNINRNLSSNKVIQLFTNYHFNSTNLNQEPLFLSKKSQNTWKNTQRKSRIV